MKTKINFYAFIMLLFLMIFQQELMANSSVNPLAEGNLTGKISDKTTGLPMEYVSVVLYSASDSSLVAGTISNTDGQFSISMLDSGSYYLEISYIGFEKQTIEPLVINAESRKLSVGEIALSPITETLNEVLVTGNRSSIEYKVDKRIVNVDKNIAAQGGTAVQALENTPSVQVDGQGNVTLRGSSDFLVLIDGKPSVLKGSNALKQLPASTIKQIEVITNPSAKYDSDGNAGIINVILKKDKLQGFSSSINLGIGVPDKNNSNATFSFRKGKMNYFAGVDYADNKYKTDISFYNTTYTGNGNKYTEELAKQFNMNQNLNFRGGIDFDPNEKNTFSISGSVGRQGYDNGTDASYHNWDDVSDGTYNFSSNYMDVSGDVISATADYKYKFSDDKYIQFTNYYTLWNGVDDNLLQVYDTDNRYENRDLSSMLNFYKDNRNYQYRSNLDFSMPVKIGKLEAGIQYRYENRQEDFQFNDYDIASGTWLQNDTFSYTQDYDNSIYSGYVTFSGNLKGLEYQFGIRSEFFTRNNVVSNADTNPKFNKFMLYPSVHLSKSVNDKHMFQLNYSRRINRPQPYLLNNTPSYIDPNNIFMGNTDLKFEFSDNFELNYRVVFNKLTLSTQTYLRNTTNSFQAVRLLNDNGQMIHQLTNAKSQVALGLEQEVNYKLFPWWQINSYINVYSYTLKTLVASSEKVQKVNTWDARIISNINLKSNTFFQVIGYYRAPGVDAMGETSGIALCNLAVNQVLFKGKVNAGITAYNIFNSIEFDYDVRTENYFNQHHLKSDFPYVMANISINLNNFQSKNRGSQDAASFKGGGAF